jgi:urease gamma subunit
MVSWKRTVGLTAMFVALAVVSFAAEGEAPAGRRGARGGGLSPEEQAKLTKASATMVAKFVAKEVELAADKTDKFVSEYVAAREAAGKRMAELMKSGDTEKFREVFTENQKAMDAVLTGSLSEDQAKKARALIGMQGLEQSVSVLLQAKVEDAKIEKALPVLAKYNAASSDLMAKVRSNELSREDMMAKVKDLRAATAKDLAPIIGEEAATTWSERAGFGGRGMGGGGGRRGGGGGEKAP